MYNKKLLKNKKKRVKLIHYQENFKLHLLQRKKFFKK